MEFEMGGNDRDTLNGNFDSRQELIYKFYALSPVLKVCPRSSDWIEKIDREGKGIRQMTLNQIRHYWGFNLTKVGFSENSK